MRDSTSFKKIFVNRLNLLIEERNKPDDTALAKKTGIDRTSIGKYKCGKRFPSKDNLKKLADFFGVSTSYLLGETDARTADDTLIGNELGIDDTTLNNLKEIKKINQKYNNEYQDILGEVLTDVTLYKNFINIIDLYVKYYSDKEYKADYDKNILMEPYDYADVNITQLLKVQVNNYLTKLQYTKKLNEKSLGKYEIETRIKRKKQELKNLNDSYKRMFQ